METASIYGYRYEDFNTEKRFDDLMNAISKLSLGSQIKYFQTETAKLCLSLSGIDRFSEDVKYDFIESRMDATRRYPQGGIIESTKDLKEEDISNRRIRYVSLMRIALFGVNHDKAKESPPPQE